MISSANLDKIHQEVPPNYYERGIKFNFFQSLWHSQRFRVISSEVKNLNITGRILDLGCHSGDLTNIISQLSQAQVYGIDLSPAAIDYAKKRFPKINFLASDFSVNIKFSDNYFNAVTAFDVLEHVPEIDATLLEIRRVLCPGGYFIVGVPSENWLFKLVWFFWIKFRGRVWKDTHINQFKDKELEIFSRRGFAKIKDKKVIFNMWRLIIFKLDK